MISQSGGHLKEDDKLSVKKQEEEVVSLEISKAMDETISIIREMKFPDDGSKDVEETM